METDLNKFFEYLAERKDDENDLSDVTYALCYSNDEFRKFFLNFCFEEKDLDTKDLTREYQREYEGGRYRPDFFFHDLRNQERLIEVKINDKNLHPKYVYAFPNAEYAFIANYKEPAPEENWKRKTWRQFNEALEKNDKLKKDPAISGYLDYLKILTEIKEFKKMNLSDYSSLPIFYDNILGLMKEYNINSWNGPKCLLQNYYGILFKKENIDGIVNNDLWFWIGICFSEKAVFIGFESGNRGFPKNIKNNIKNCEKNSEHYSIKQRETVYNLGDTWFMLKEDKFKMLCDNNINDNTQKTVLKDFFDSVIDAIGAKEYICPDTAS